MDLSANCSSRLSARVSDLHPLFLSVRGSEWVNIDTADEITRPSMHPFRWHWSVLCSVLLWWSHKSANHWPMKHLFMAHFASGSAAAEMWADRQCVDAVFPAADAEIKTRWPSASLACHGTLNTISSLSCLPKQRGTVWGNPGRDLSKTGRADQDTHRRSELWRRKDHRAEKE